VKRVSIPGFRKGKAPRAILERHIGKAGLMDEAIDYMVPAAYQQALEEQQIEPITRPDIEVVQTEPGDIQGGDSATSGGGAGGTTRASRRRRRQATITDTEVDSVLEQMRHQQAAWEPVERPGRGGRHGGAGH